MHTDGLFEALSNIHPVSDNFKKALEKELIPLSLPRNHQILEAPKIADHAYFLNRGFAMGYTFFDGRKIVEAFWKSHQVIVSSSSFFEQVPSSEFIQLMTDADLLCLSHASMQILFHAFPEANDLYRILMSRHYQHSQSRIRDMQLLSAQQHLEKLLATFPDLEQLVTQDCIASYLGIAPQSLSRLKRGSASS